MLPWQTLQTSTDCQTNSYGTVDQTGQTLPEFANAKVSTQVGTTSVELVVTEFRRPLQVQSHLEMPGILVQLGHIQRTQKLAPQTDPKWSPTRSVTRYMIVVIFNIKAKELHHFNLFCLNTVDFLLTLDPLNAFTNCRQEVNGLLIIVRNGYQPWYFCITLQHSSLHSSSDCPYFCWSLPFFLDDTIW